MDYLDFELHISPGSGRQYPVTLVKSPAGVASGTLQFPFDTLALEHQLRGLELAVLKSGSLRRDIVLGSPETASVADFGRQLFGALFSDQIQTAFRRSQDRAQSERKGLRVRLRVDAPDLAALPWEFMYDPSEGDYVCLSSGTPVVRYFEFDRPPEVVTVQRPLSVLGVIASPSDRPALDVQHERERIEQATSRLQASGDVKVEWMAGSTWRDLQRAMRRGPYHMLHFVGHGGFDPATGEGVLALTDDAGRSALLSATEMGRLLADHPSLRLVVLNACLGARGSGEDVFSSTSSILVRRGVPAVVAMQYEISDLAAIEFSRSFYDAIAEGLPIDAAVAEARKAVSVSSRNSVEWATPVLHMSAPDGVLFRFEGPARPAARLASSTVPASPPAGPSDGAGHAPPTAAPSAATAPVAGTASARPLVAGASAVAAPTPLQTIARFVLSIVLGVVFGLVTDALLIEGTEPGLPLLAFCLGWSVAMWFALATVKPLQPRG